MNEAQPATAESRLRRAVPARLKQWVREPLLHFLVIGAMLFGIHSYINRGRAGIELSKQIAVSLDDLHSRTARTMALLSGEISFGIRRLVQFTFSMSGKGQLLSK